MKEEGSNDDGGKELRCIIWLEGLCAGNWEAELITLDEYELLCRQIKISIY